MRAERFGCCSTAEFDAVIAALVARAHALDGTHPVPSAVREQADREGWIVLPNVGFEGVAGS